ncbi:outer membrane protein [Desulfatitalea alkaliphila]|uniref:Outer membrane beta-barrel protein n=1 Tax=Desulfatitalea alkaliphila TaxID=2929485 RepID=A0AA41R5V7_9BACT|nr:outer membrane beta-barrel protein [Desulfatitalea alkaliphila]MCJ8499733.1 outer membrane beta-barrel protein [Desulfatitalea alkaliphila]
MQRFSVVFVSVLFILVNGASASATSHNAVYFRGAVAAMQSTGADFSDKDCSSTSPPALFGCGAGNDGRPLGAYGDFGEYLAMEIAAGRYVSPWLRIDLAFNYRPNMNYSGTANFRGVSGPQPVSSTARSLSAMANLFIELGPILNISSDRWHPYIGTGVGVSYNRLKEVEYLFPEATTHKISITPSGERFDPAFTFFGGLGVALSREWMIDISVRYEDLGRVETDRGGMYMNHIPQDLEIDKTSAALRGFGLALGVRYSFF